MPQSDDLLKIAKLLKEAYDAMDVLVEDDETDAETCDALYTAQTSLGPTIRQVFALLMDGEGDPDDLWARIEENPSVKLSDVFKAWREERGFDATE